MDESITISDITISPLLTPECEAEIKGASNKEERKM